MIEITKVVLERGMTPKQQEMIARLYDANRVRDIHISLDFSLPESYISVLIKYIDGTGIDGTGIYGGIDSDGVMST